MATTRLPAGNPRTDVAPGACRGRRGARLVPRHAAARYTAAPPISKLPPVVVSQPPVSVAFPTLHCRTLARDWTHPPSPCPRPTAPAPTKRVLDRSPAPSCALRNPGTRESGQEWRGQRHVQTQFEGIAAEDWAPLGCIRRAQGILCGWLMTTRRPCTRTGAGSRPYRKGKEAVSERVWQCTWFFDERATGCNNKESNFRALFFRCACAH